MKKKQGNRMFEYESPQPHKWGAGSMKKISACTPPTYQVIFPNQ